MADIEPPKPKGRSFLKKPDWLKDSEAQAGSKTTDEPTELFSRSGDTYEEILALKEQRRKQKEERRRDRREAKRRRVSQEEKSFRGIEDCREGNVGNDEQYEPPNFGVNEDIAKEQPETKATIIDLDDSDDDGPHGRYDGPAGYQSRNLELKQNPSSRMAGSFPNGKRLSNGLDDDDLGIRIPPKPAPIPNEDEEDLDPELAARARARRARLQQVTAGSTTTGLPTRTGDPSAAISDEPDPVIRVLIQPRIEGTEPLLVKRKYRQRIKECREAWCSRQPSLAGRGIQPSDVIFAYRGRRIYDSSTIKSLGIALDADGAPVFPATDPDGQPEPGDQIVLAATTQVLLEADRKAEEEARRRREQSEPSENEAQEPLPPEEQRDRGLRIVLKAKGYKDVKIIVRPDSTFDRIARVFRKERELPAETQIMLMFDGEPLRPEMEVKDSEIEDMDCLEVHAK